MSILEELEFSKRVLCIYLLRCTELGYEAILETQR